MRGQGKELLSGERSRKIALLYKELSAGWGPNFSGLAGSICLGFEVIRANPFDFDSPKITGRDEALLQVLSPICTAAFTAAHLEAGVGNRLHGDRFDDFFMKAYGRMIGDLNKKIGEMS